MIGENDLNPNLTAEQWTEVLKVKHLDEISPKDQELAYQLAKEAERLWTEFGLRNDKESQTNLAKAAENIKKIQEIGFRVVLDLNLAIPSEDDTPKLVAKVELHTLRMKPGQA